MNWSTNPATTENWFATGEPNNSGGTEGSTHIYNTSGNAERRWNDLSGSTTTFTGSAMNQLIIEFNE